MPSLTSLRTGDLVLFTHRPIPQPSTSRSTLSSLTSLTSWWTTLTTFLRQHTTGFRPPTHLGIVLHCPTFVHPCLDGTYLWHAPDPSSPRLTIVPLAEAVASCVAQGGDVRVRQWVSHREGFPNATPATLPGQVGTGTNTAMQQVYHHVALENTTSEWHRLVSTTFSSSSSSSSSSSPHWSTAFVAYAYRCCRVLDPTRTLWHKLDPTHFAQATERLWYASGVLDLGGGSEGREGARGAIETIEDGEESRFWVVGGGAVLGKERVVW